MTKRQKTELTPEHYRALKLPDTFAHIECNRDRVIGWLGGMSPRTYTKWKRATGGRANDTSSADFYRIRQYQIDHSVLSDSQRANGYTNPADIPIPPELIRQAVEPEEFDTPEDQQFYEQDQVHNAAAQNAIELTRAAQQVIDQFGEAGKMVNQVALNQFCAEAYNTSMFGNQLEQHPMFQRLNKMIRGEAPITLPVDPQALANHTYAISMGDRPC